MVLKRPFSIRKFWETPSNLMLLIRISFDTKIQFVHLKFFKNRPHNYIRVIHYRQTGVLILGNLSGYKHACCYFIKFLVPQKSYFRFFFLFYVRSRKRLNGQFNYFYPFNRDISGLRCPCSLGICLI